MDKNLQIHFQGKILYYMYTKLVIELYYQDIIIFKYKSINRGM